MRPPSVARETVIERLARAFRSDGFERATLRKLSHDAGLERASLYHLFPGGKAEMIAAALEYAAGEFERRVLSALVAPGSPAERFDAMLNGLDRYYERGAEPCMLGTLALEMPSDTFGSAVRAGFDKWIGLLEALFREEGLGEAESSARALEVVALVQGALLITRGLQRREVFQELIARARRSYPRFHVRTE